MILTKDNLLRYVREKKAVTPTMVAESFDTTTMIASAALSELAKDKLIAITNLKLASSPYYYDLKQKSYLMELGEKHLSKHEKDIFLKLKQKEIVSDNSLTIQERLAIEKIKDFAVPLSINFQGNDMLFWVWYMRNVDETRKQILDALNPSKKSSPPPASSNTIEPKKIVREIKEELSEASVSSSGSAQSQRTVPDFNKHQVGSQNLGQSQQQVRVQQQTPAFKPPSAQSQEDSQIESFIEHFFRQNYLKIENKNKEEKGILYETSLQLNKMKIKIDCFYFYKKTNESELMKFHTSSLAPKIVFVVNCPKKLLKLSENIENLTIVNI